MAALSSIVALKVGVTKLNTAQINNTTGTLDFTVPQLPWGPTNALFQAVGSLTGLASALLVSLDGGTTFSSYIGTFLAAATPVFAVSAALGNSGSNANANPLVPGAIFRINITALTGTADIYVAIG